MWALDSTWAVIDHVLDRWPPAMLPEEVERWYGDDRQLHRGPRSSSGVLTHDAYHCGELSQTLGIEGQPQIDLWRPLTRSVETRQVGYPPPAPCVNSRDVKLRLTDALSPLFCALEITTPWSVRVADPSVIVTTPNC